jgi:hypothetical protein
MCHRISRRLALDTIQITFHLLRSRSIEMMDTVLHHHGPNMTADMIGLHPATTVQRTADMETMAGSMHLPKAKDISMKATSSRRTTRRKQRPSIIADWRSSKDATFLRRHQITS